MLPFVHNTSEVDLTPACLLATLISTSGQLPSALLALACGSAFSLPFLAGLLKYSSFRSNAWPRLLPTRHLSRLQHNMGKSMHS